MTTKAKIITPSEALKGWVNLNKEIRYKNCFAAKQFTAGLIAFRPHKAARPRQINHEDKDVVCQVLEGYGQLRIHQRRRQLRPGMICHIPKKTPHDFAAGTKGDLVLFYSLIKTG